jgi:hypothetical protein
MSESDEWRLFEDFNGDDFNIFDSSETEDKCFNDWLLSHAMDNENDIIATQSKTTKVWTESEIEQIIHSPTHPVGKVNLCINHIYE